MLIFNKTSLAFDQTFLENTKLKVFYQGKEIPESSTLKSFSQLSLHEKLKSNLENMGFEMMTPIQKEVLPYILKGHDTIGCAQTGSGKTVSFLAPIVNKMLIDGPPKTDAQLPNGVSAPVALIVVPTRELAEQIYKEARKIIHKTGIVVVKVYGGIPIDSQYKHIVNGCDILVATPGRLIDFIKRDTIVLNSVKFLVFDEADRMLDMGFEDQLREIVFCSDIPAKENRINMMFSATFDKNVRDIARMFMNDYYFISKAYDQENTANENISQELVYSEENQKVLKLHETLQRLKGSVLSNDI
jgi:superfamily II DNA/RNA helicase